MRRYVNHLDHTQFVRSLNEQFATMARGGCFATDMITVQGRKVGYMYREPPQVQRTDHSVTELLREMDRYGIERGLVPVDLADCLSTMDSVNIGLVVDAAYRAGGYAAPGGVAVGRSECP